MTGSTEDGQSVSTTYALSNGTVLLANASGKVTAYLYGNGAIGEQTDAWSYALIDGAGTPRQMVDQAAKVTAIASYTPWGDVLNSGGTGAFATGYLGGMMDAATGLIYVGNGQYYDPLTGRFLTREANSSQTNPYVPWKGDPAGALISPIMAIALFFRRKKKISKVEQIAILLFLAFAIGICLSACSGQTATIPTEEPPVEITETPTYPNGNTETSTATAATTPTAANEDISTPSDISLTPTPSGPLQYSCNSGVWFVNDDDDGTNLEILAKRLYFEGASSFSDIYAKDQVFMAQAWALRTLKINASWLSGYSYLEVSELSFSIHGTKDGESWGGVDSQHYIEMARKILNNEPCSSAPNPFMGRIIQWISPQNLHRLKEPSIPVTFNSNRIPGCTDNKCELPDIRLRDWLKYETKTIGSVEQFINLGQITETKFTECYWIGVYFHDYADTVPDPTNNGAVIHTHDYASNGKYLSPATEQSGLACPIDGLSGAPIITNLNLPSLPSAE